MKGGKRKEKKVDEIHHYMKIITGEKKEKKKICLNMKNEEFF